MNYPKHIQWIIDNIGEDLTKALSQDNSYEKLNNPFNIFLSADPTSKKKLTQWLVETYIKEGFRWEDIQSGSNSKVFDTLSLYIKHKSKLDSTNHVGQYDTLGDIYKDIAQFIKLEKSSRSVKRDEQARAYEESEILIKLDSGESTTNSLVVVIPKTEYASKWWGKGTQWCTAGDKNNMFHDYYNNGPLIIIIVNGVKTQLHVNLVSKNHSVQFMDEYDKVVKKDFIEDNWNLLSPIIEWAVINNGNTLRIIPESLRIESLCLEAVKNDGSILGIVPKRFRTAELCLEAVNQCSGAIIYVPERLRTLDLCRKVKNPYGKSLCFIHKKLITPELCLEEVKINPRVLPCVPKSLRTLEMCLLALKEGDYSRYIPKRLKILELYLEVVRHNGWNLRYVPQRLITLKMCLEAVNKHGWVLDYVPKHLRTADLCLVAVRQNAKALEYVPEHLKTAELCLDAVMKYGMALKYVPEHLRTLDLCLEAVKQDGRVLYYIPAPLKTIEICLEAVKKSGGALCYVPKSLITPELCLEAVRQNSGALYYVPEDLITAELCLEAVKKNSWCLNYVPQHLRRADIYLEAVRCNSNDFIDDHPEYSMDLWLETEDHRNLEIKWSESTVLLDLKLKIEKIKLYATTNKPSNNPSICLKKLKNKSKWLVNCIKDYVEFLVDRVT